MGLYRWYQRHIYPAKEWIRQRLENNKVFFEIFSGLIIAGATVWVAIQANNIADRSNELADREIQMSYMENLPLFSLDIIQKEKGPLENGKGIEDAHIEYVLMNYGGFMAEVSSNIKSLIEKKIYEQNSLLTKEEVNSKTLLYYVNLPQFYKPYSYYDYSDNTLTFKSYFFDYSDMIEILRTNLKADGKFISIKHIQEVQLYYKDVYGKMMHYEKFNPVN